MQIKDLNAINNDAVSLGKFLFDGTVTGKVTVTGSMDTFYAGWLMTGASAGSSWFISPAAGSVASVNDTVAAENYFRDSFHVGGDIRNILSLTSIGSNGIIPVQTPPVFLPPTIGTEITVMGKIGEVYAVGTVAAVDPCGRSKRHSQSSRFGSPELWNEFRRRPCLHIQGGCRGGF